MTDQFTTLAEWRKRQERRGRCPKIMAAMDGHSRYLEKLISGPLYWWDIGLRGAMLVAAKYRFAPAGWRSGRQYKNTGQFAIGFRRTTDVDQAVGWLGTMDYIEHVSLHTNALHRDGGPLWRQRRDGEGER